MDRHDDRACASSDRPTGAGGPGGRPHSPPAGGPSRGDARVDRHVHRARADRVHDLHARLRAAPHEGGRPRSGTASSWSARGPAPSSASSWSGGCASGLTEQQLLLSSLWLIAISAAGLCRVGHSVRSGRPGLHRRVVRRGGPALVRRHDPALHPDFGPGPRLCPLRHAPAAGLGDRVADPADHRLHAPAGRRHHGGAGRAGRPLLRVGTPGHAGPRASSTATSGSCPEASRPVSPAASRACRPARSGLRGGGRRTSRSTPG